MTEDDIKEAQAMIEQAVQIIGVMEKANKDLKEVVLKHQKFVLDRISGKKHE